MKVQLFTGGCVVIFKDKAIYFEGFNTLNNYRALSAIYGAENVYYSANGSIDFGS